MAIIALISQREVAGKILDHVRLPNDPEPLGDGVTLAYDVTGEPIGDWVVGTDPEHPAPQGYEPKWTEASLLAGVHVGLRSRRRSEPKWTECSELHGVHVGRRAHMGESPGARSQRGPPPGFDGVDPPCPDEYG